MNRMLSRTFFAIALIAALLAAAPAVQARPLAKPARSVPSVQTAGGDLLSAAWSWLSHLFTFEPVAAKSGSGSTTTTTSGGGLGGAKPLSGSCIDPNGCTIGGGGL